MILSDKTIIFRYCALLKGGVTLQSEKEHKIRTINQ